MLLTRDLVGKLKDFTKALNLLKNTLGFFAELAILINPIQDGLFRSCSRIGGEKALLSLKFVTHILHDETWYSYTLPKQDPKAI